LKPILITVPASLTYNWQRELKRFFNSKHKEINDAPLIHSNSDGCLLEEQNVHIVSNAIIGKPDLLKELLEYGFKTIIVDESHQFKNDKSLRTEALMQLTSVIPHKILMSGTSIMNRAMEYYNTLNILSPNQWPNKNWLASYCNYDSKGKLLGLNAYKKQAFFDRTKGYILRRTKTEVLPDLPEKQVNYTYITLTDKKQFVQGYNKLLDELEQHLTDIKRKMVTSTNILGLMSNIRHFIGLAKVSYIAELADEFLENTEDEQLTIGVHHKLVRENLALALSRWNPIQISDEDAKIKDQRITAFREGKSRLLIASILGCGIGLNIQFCRNVISAEREWNRSIEAQFEDRFHRIGSTNKVNIDYLMAGETLDEFFHDLVQLKGMVSGGFLNQDLTIDNNFMMELAERCVQKRLRYAG
jgi:SNF2 family DNA or RNA helicase